MRDLASIPGGVLTVCETGILLLALSRYKPIPYAKFPTRLKYRVCSKVESCDYYTKGIGKTKVLDEESNFYSLGTNKGKSSGPRTILHYDCLALC
jgi:hypothetical protein